MRVCLLARYFDYRGTGVTRLSTEITKGLVGRRYSVRKVSTKGGSLYSYFFYTLLEIPLILPRHNIDVYHALTALEGMWLPRDKSVVTFVDLFTVTHPERTGAGMGYNKWKQFVGNKYFLFGSKLASKVRFITCISDLVKSDLVEVLGIPEHRIKVIRLGISEELQPQIKKDEVFRIGTLSQLDRRKRVDLLIKAFRNSSLDAELVIGGIGMDEPKLKALATGDNRIKFLGLVPESRLVDFYNSLDVFVFPTWIEGYGLPIVEAMACGKPIIVLPDAVIPEELKLRCITVEDLGLMFSNQTYLESLYKNVDYKDNYKFAKEHSWSKTIDEYIELYREITG